MRGTDDPRQVRGVPAPATRAVPYAPTTRAVPAAVVNARLTRAGAATLRSAPVIRETDDDKPKDDDEDEKKVETAAKKKPWTLFDDEGGTTDDDKDKPTEVKKDAGDAGDFESMSGDVTGTDANADDDSTASNDTGKPDTPSGASA